MVGRKQLAICKVVQRTDRLLVLELSEAIATPYTFEVTLKDERLRCEFKSQFGPRLHAIIVPIETATAEPDDDSCTVAAVSAKWRGQARGFLRN